MNQKIEFDVKETESQVEKEQLIAIFREGNVGIGYDSSYDKELVAVDKSGNILGGMQVSLQDNGRYSGQPCPTYVVNNIGLAKRFWKKKSGLGTALIDKLKEECRQYKVHAIAIGSERASELAFRNDFELLFAPDQWILCVEPECKLYSNCVRRTDFLIRQYSNNITDQRLLFWANKYPVLAKYLKKQGFI